MFGLLPDDQATELRSLWDEFEEGQTPEARYAAAIDGLQPLLNHLLSGARDDGEDRPSQSQVLDKKRNIADSAEALWQLAQDVIKRSTDAGLYRQG